MPRTIDTMNGVGRPVLSQDQSGNVTDLEGFFSTLTELGGDKASTRRPGSQDEATMLHMLVRPGQFSGVRGWRPRTFLTSRRTKSDVRQAVSDARLPSSRTIQIGGVHVVEARSGYMVNIRPAEEDVTTSIAESRVVCGGLAAAAKKLDGVGWNQFNELPATDGAADIVAGYVLLDDGITSPVTAQELEGKLNDHIGAVLVLGAIATPSRFPA